MIRAVIFDCFGVLYTDGKSQIIDRCPDENKQALSDLFMQADYGFVSGDEFSIEAARLLNIDISVLKKMMNGMYSRNELLIDRIRLYKQKFKIGLLSNTSEQLFNDLFSQAEQEELFDTVVLSSKVGIIKPSKDIYSLILSKLGVNPEESVMIDDVERNVQGARDSGMHGIRFETTPQLFDDLELLVAQEDKNA